MTKPKRASALATASVMIGVLIGCASEADRGSGFAESTSGGSGSVTLLEQPWIDLQVENRIAEQLLEKIGYDVSISNVSVELGVQALETGDVDAYIGNWWPSQEVSFGAPIEAGKIDVRSTLPTGTEYSPAVPEDTAEQLDISSLADLDEHAEEFGKRIYGIEPSAPGNQTVQQMIDDDAYGLGDWKLVESGTPAMLTQVQRAVNEDEPIVFLAWTPHWMALEYGTVFLDDPEGVWSSAGKIRTLVRDGYAEEEPEITSLLDNLRFSPKDASRFYFDHDKKGMSLQQIAADWIEENPDAVKTFLKGVESADDKPAEAEVFD